MGLAEELAKKYGIKGVGQEAIVGLIVNQVLELAAQEAEKEASFHWTCAGEVSCPESDVADAIASRIRKLKE